MFPPGVTVIGADNLPAQIPTAASSAYAQNIVALLARMQQDGSTVIDLTDPVQAAIVVTHDRLVLNESVWRYILEGDGPCRPALSSPGHPGAVSLSMPIWRAADIAR